MTANYRVGDAFMIDPERIGLIDIEASGLGPLSYPLEIAYSPGEEQYESFLINPDTAQDWAFLDPAAEAMHGITRAHAVAAGEDVMAVAWKLNEALGTGTWFTDGYDEDVGWITRLYEEVLFESTFRLASLQGLLQEAGGNLAAQYDDLAMMAQPAHRAAADLQAIRELIRRLAPQR